MLPAPYSIGPRAPEDSPLEALLRRIREARFADGISCPRCNATKVCRWGTFSGRQRYRCGRCRRTFSDLTGTPAAYIKKLTKWPVYLEHMCVGSSLRYAARSLRIHPATSFRWRHRILDELRQRDSSVLRGWVEVDWLWVRYSEKRPGRGRSHFQDDPLLGTTVVLACDRLGSTVGGQGAVTRASRVSSLELEDILAPRLPARPVLLSWQGQYSAIATLARRRAGRFFQVARRPPSPPAPPRDISHLRTVLAYRIRLTKWLTRFRGVGTQRLPNYLAWHAAVDQGRQAFRSRALQWPI